MKVIKRDGRAVEYDSDKIRIAIGKANNEVLNHEKATDRQIDNVIKYIESLDKKRMLVEDIQDIIETKLMEQKRFNLAKKYIIYRYSRALVRKANTTDESILSVIKGNNYDVYESFDNSIPNQRSLIESEVSKDLTMRVLLSKKIVNAHEEGKLYFHNMSSFIHPMFVSSYINIYDMLENGTIINGKKIDSPKDFKEACLMLQDIIRETLDNQCGSLAIDISVLSKYLKLSYDNYLKYFKDKMSNFKEIVDHLFNQELKYGIEIIRKSLININKYKFVNLFLNIKDDRYLDFNLTIIEEVLKSSLVNKFDCKLTYPLTKNNVKEDSKYYYLTKLVLDSSKNNLVSFVSEKKIVSIYGSLFSPFYDGGLLTNYKAKSGEEKYYGRFNQGVVTINLPQIALLSDKDMNKFWHLLEERLELCKEALMCKYYSLLGTLSNVSLINWCGGAITRLDKDEKIDYFLKNGYSTLSLGYLGLDETIKILDVEVEKQDELKIEILKYMADKCKLWNEETGLGFVLYGTSNPYICNAFYKKDKEKFGSFKTFRNLKAYSRSYFLNDKDFLENKTLNVLDDITNGGSIRYVSRNALISDQKMLQYIYDNIKYVEVKVEKNESRN